MAEPKETPSIKPQKSWRDAFSTPEKIMQFAAVWPTQESSLFRTFKIIIFVLTTILFLLFNLVELKSLLLKKDYEVLSTHLSTLGLYIGYPVKMVIFLFKKRGLNHILEIIEKPLFDECPAEMQKRKDKCISLSSGIANFYLSVVVVSVFMYLAKPLYTDTNLPMTFSYDLTLVTYTLMLLLQCFSCYFIVVVGNCFDMLAIALVNIATTQLDILGETIMTFKPNNVASSDEEHCFFQKCVQKHEIIIRFVNETEKVFRFMLLSQCLGSITGICNGAFQLTHTEELLSVHFIFNCAFAFDMLFDIGICCWFGGLLTIQSLKMSDACFNYNWIDSPTSTKKHLLIILCRSQRPLYLTIGKFAQLSMASYLMMLKTAYSYFAVMQSLYDKENNH